jgi:AsmA-like C-terminal region
MASPQPTIDVPSLQIVPKPRRRSPKWHWIVVFLLILTAASAVWIWIVLARAQPILRAKIVETLSARFHSRVELADLHVWIANGVRVQGGGLKIYGVTDPNPWAPGVQPLIEIGAFHFESDVRSLLRDRTHINTVYVNGLTMNIPPKGERQQMNNLQQGHNKIRMIVDQFLCTDAKLLVNTSKPGKAPLQFDITTLLMRDVGPGEPMPFAAVLTNPKPVGDIRSTGVFGPLDLGNVRETPVLGAYSFNNADLGTLKGIGGILSSEGLYSGLLGRITVDGETDTPDFSLNISGHRVPLHTEFHAIVDGTDGDTYLQPVKATLLRSSFTAKGKIVRRKDPPGHDIELHVVLDRAFIEDLLKLGVKTDPPVMSGPVAMTTDLSLEPGPEDISSRLKLAGTFHIRDGQFSNDKVQDRIDSLSLRSQGKPKLAQEHVDVNVPSDLSGTFRLRDGVLAFSDLQFGVPGTRADMTGQYSLDGKTFDIHGTLRLDAKLSQTMTGWKSILLKPVDPFFAKHGAGAEVPFKVTGTNDEPHFGLDFGRDKSDKSNEQR